MEIKMIKIILGLILLLLPFLLINKFENKKLGFFYIFSFMIGFHLFVSVITQLFGIFNYEVIFGINLLVAVFVFIRTDFRKLFEDLKRLKIDWMLIFIIIVLFIQLYSVHYNYAGEVTTIQTHITGENIITQNMKYTYPYVDDEWASVSLIKYSIISGKLPLVNPLWDNIYFPNPQLGFHSFVSGLIQKFVTPFAFSDIVSISSSLIFSNIVFLLVFFSHNT